METNSGEVRRFRQYGTRRSRERKSVKPDLADGPEHKRFREIKSLDLDPTETFRLQLFAAVEEWKRLSGEGQLELVDGAGI